MSHQSEKSNQHLLSNWKPENAQFWENKGKHIARRNLWISVACLLLAFCVWMLFSAIAVNLNKVGFNFSTDQLFYANGITFSLRRDIACPLLFYGADIWRALLDRVKHRYPWSYPVSGLGSPSRIPPRLTGSLSSLHCCAVLPAPTSLPAWETSVSSSRKPDRAARWALTAGWVTSGVSVMQLVAPLVIFLPMFTFLGVHGVPRRMARRCGWRTRRGSGRRC